MIDSYLAIPYGHSGTILEGKVTFLSRDFPLCGVADTFREGCFPVLGRVRK